MPLDGKVCVVTGASRGIGRACAEALAAAGGRVAVCASSSAPEAPAGGFSHQCDVSNQAEVEALIESSEPIPGPPL